MRPPALEREGARLRYRFAGFELDDDAFVLRHEGEKVDLQPKPFLLLHRLLASGGRIVRKEELLEELWPDVLVGDTSLTRAVRAVRRALGESAEGAGVIRTVRGRGYGIGVEVELVPSFRSPQPQLPTPPTKDGLVGRREVLAKLESLFARAREGHGGVVFIDGEPGIGKSRVLTEAVEAMEASGARPLWGRTWEGEGAPAFQPWARVFRAIFRTLSRSRLDAFDDVDGAALSALVPELREHFPQLGAPPEQDPAQARYQLFESCVRLMELACAESPLVIALDDLHAADEGSVRLLHAVARQIDSLRCLVICTWREPSDTRTSPGVLAALRREPTLTQVHLGPLDENEAAELLRRSGSDLADPSFTRALQARTEGNPFFILELARHLRGQSGARGAEGSGGALVAGAVPESIRDLVGRRMGALSPECQRVLGVASVYGREFPLGLVARALELEPEEMLDHLEEAEAREIVARVPGSLERYRFSHALMREALYESLSTRDRVRLHQRLAAMLEVAYQNTARNYWAELAYHFGAAAASGAEPGKAQEYATRAGDLAMEQLAYEQAARSFAQALAALESRGEAPALDDAELLIRLGAAHAASGATGEARTAYERAATLARASREGRLLARAALGLSGEQIGFSNPALPDPRAEGLLEEALSLAGEDDRELGVRLLGALAMRLYWTDERPRTEELSRRALALVERSESPRLRALALARRHSVLWHAGGLDERLTLVEEILPLARQAGDEALLIQAHLLQVLDQLETGDMDAIRSRLATFGDLAARLRMPQWRYVAQMVGSTCDTLEGRFERADEEIEQARLTGDPLGFQPVYLWQKAQLRVLEGRFEGIDAVLGPIEQLASALRPEFHWSTMLSWIHLEMGRTDDARSEYERARVRGDDPLSGPHSLLPLAVHGLICARTGDTAHAPLLLERLAPFADRYVVGGFGVSGLGSAARYLGLLAASLGRSSDAIGYFERALERNRALRARPFECLTRLDLGEHLLATAAPSARQRALVELSSAREDALKLRMQAASARAERLLGS